MPPTKRARKAVSAAAGTAPTSSGTATPAPATPDAAASETTAPATSGGQAPPHELRLNLPFLTVTLTRPAHEHRPGRESAASRPAAEKPATPSPETQSGERLIFYAGVAALGVAGVVEWPVAAAIAAGTWIASRARSGGGRTEARPALPVGTQSTPAGSETTPAP